MMDGFGRIILTRVVFLLPILYCTFYIALYNSKINARVLVGQSAMVYCAGKPMEKSASSELLYKSNRLQVSMVYRLINHLGCW